LIVHVLSVSGMDVAEKVPFVWMLHVGIFVVWIPAVISQLQNKEFLEFRNSSRSKFKNPITAFKILFRGVPGWLVVLVLVSFVYAFVNFMLSIGSVGGTVSVEDGQYVLGNHGTFIKTLTEQEYQWYRANELRGFSGHWMAFYGMGAAILYPFGKVGRVREGETV
jgi:hypothetical protein